MTIKRGGLMPTDGLGQSSEAFARNQKIKGREKRSEHLIKSSGDPNPAGPRNQGMAELQRCSVSLWLRCGLARLGLNGAWRAKVSASVHPTPSPVPPGVPGPDVATPAHSAHSG